MPLLRYYSFEFTMFVRQLIMLLLLICRATLALTMLPMLLAAFLLFYYAYSASC